MAAITRENPQQFRVKFDELPRRGFPTFGRREVVQVDPFLIGRAVAEVMNACSVRSAAGRPLLWNDYRVILARADFDLLGPLQGSLDRDLRETLAREAAERDADLVGELRLTIVADEGNELAHGLAVVRTAFVPTDRFVAPAAGEMTVHIEGPMAGGAVDATIAVPEERTTRSARYLLRWPGGTATVAAGRFVVIGRPHPDAPGQFVALEGASAKINKQHFVLATGAATVKIGRLPNANPIEVNGASLAAGAEVEVTPPVRISLSRDELVLELSKA